MLKIKHSGNLKTGKTLLFLEAYKNFNSKIMPLLNKYGRLGVEALSASTPVDTGLTAASWNYRIENNGYSYRLIWYNTNVQKGNMIALLLQYGHGTRNGGYFEGIDYINPAMRPIFDNFSKEIGDEVRKLGKQH